MDKIEATDRIMSMTIREREGGVGGTIISIEVARPTSFVVARATTQGTTLRQDTPPPLSLLSIATACVKQM